jgi:hypothetical protein
LKTNGRYRALLFMGCWLGPRWNEAIGLRVCDINPLRKELSFGRIVVNQNGNTAFTEAMSKTDDARTVPAEVMDVLLEHLRVYRPDAEREGFLFVNNAGNHILRSTFARNVLAKSVKRAGLDGRHVTWLTLRHPAASLMFDAGLTIFEVQQRLGHRSPTMTAEVYTRLMRERRTCRAAVASARSSECASAARSGSVTVSGEVAGRQSATVRLSAAQPRAAAPRADWPCADQPRRPLRSSTSGPLLCAQAQATAPASRSASWSGRYPPIDSTATSP